MFLLFFAVITDSKNRQDHSKETFVSNRRLGFQPKFVITKSSFKTTPSEEYILVTKSGS